MDVKRIPVPNGKNYQEILATLKEYTENYKIAGFIYEPIIQKRNIDSLWRKLNKCDLQAGKWVPTLPGNSDEPRRLRLVPFPDRMHSSEG